MACTHSNRQEYFNMSLFLLSFVFTGLSNGDNVYEKYTGSYSFKVPARAEYLRFTPSDGYSTGESVLLWTRSNPEATIRGKIYSNSRDFKIDQLTQEDIGRYTFETTSRRSVGTTRIFVESECVFLCISFIINVVEPRASGWLNRLVATDDWTQPHLFVVVTPNILSLCIKKSFTVPC